MCNKFNLRNSTAGVSFKIAEQLMVEQSHKVIYCEVPKVGCSNWKRILILLQMNLSADPSQISHQAAHFNSPVKRLSSFPPDMWSQFLSNYTKVMFTRDPFERLVSAYRNKFLHTLNNYFYAVYIANIIKSKFRASNSTGNVTFVEYVRHVLSEDPTQCDPHWRPMQHLCDPCNVQYDVLGKLQTVDEDSEQVLKLIRAPTNLHFPNAQQYEGEAQTDKTMATNYLRNLSAEYLQEIIEMYKLDFMLFDYPIYL
ncbi:carbohydrate sulfotransferase 8-like [Pleurodeles waltl]